MTKDKAIRILKRYNKWRRGAEIMQPNPTELGIAIDIVIASIENVPEIIPKSNIISQ